MPIRLARYALALSVGLVIGCNKSPASPDPIGPAPSAAPQAVLRISPGPAEAPLGAEAHTPFVFDGSASTGDGLTYQIEFGDGESASASVASHVVGSAGERTARLTVTDRHGRTAVAEQPYFVAKVETNYPYTYWQGNYTDGKAVRITLKRDGTTFSGLAHIFGTRNIPISGHMSGDRDLVLRSNDGGIEMLGALEWEDGHVRFSQVRVAVRLTIRGGHADGVTVLLGSVDTY